MHIILSKIGRKFNYDWIFRNIDFEFVTGNAYAILGSNGSGKSTLLQIISGHLHPSEGQITYFTDEKPLPVESFFRHVTYSGPYLELIEEFTLAEMVKFHSHFRTFRAGMTSDDVIAATSLGKNQHKPLKYFSSGMKQRVRLALALLSQSEVVLLDEPAANLDQNAIGWYRKLITDQSDGRIIIVCSNSQAAEYDFATDVINIDNFKPKLK